MRQFGTSGVWELFLPGVASGAHYKFVILGADGQWREKADPMAFHTEVPPATSSVVFESRHQWSRRRLDDRTSRGRRGRQADVGLRGAPRVVATRQVVRRDGRRARDVLPGPGLHPRRVPARDGAPVRWLVGLPGDVVLRTDVALRRPRRLPAPGRHPAPARDRRDPRLGARALPEGRVRARAVRRHAALRGPEPVAWRAPRLGHATSSTSAAARCATSWSPTRCTGSRSSTSTGCAWTPSRRCSTSTTRASRASGRRTCTAAARTSRRCSSSRR